MIDPSNLIDNTPRKVPFYHGWYWIRDAFFLVREQPLTWILYSAIYLLLQVLANMIPGVGQLLAMVAVPVFTGSFVLLAQRASQGETLRISDLQTGLKQYPRPLIGLGFAYVGLLMAAMLLAILLFAGGNMPGKHMSQMPFGEMLAAAGLMLIAMIAATLLYWFAPAAVVLAGQKPWQAMRLSLQAGVRNTGAILFCGSLLAITMLLAMLPWGLGLVLWLPIMFVSVFTAWQDVFPARGIPTETGKVEN